MNPVAIFFSLVVIGLINPLGSSGNIEEGELAWHFNLFCRIYKIAAADHSTLYDQSVVNQILGIIDQVNASIGDSAWFDKILEESGSRKESEPTKTKEASEEDGGRRAEEAVRSVAKGGLFSRLKSDAAGVAVGRKKLARIEKQATDLFEKIQSAVRRVDVAEMKKKFKAVLYGDKQQEEDATIYTGQTGRKETCSAASGFSSTQGLAGRSLLLDFLCLCGKDGSGQDKACGTNVDMSKSGRQAWGANDGRNGLENWKVIKAACQDMNYPTTGFAAQGRNAVTEFIAALERPTKTHRSTVQSGVFGTCEHSSNAASNGCNGLKAAGNCICAFYGTRTDGGWTNINWLQNLNAALQILETAEQTKEIIARDISQLEVFKNRAEQIYEEAKTYADLEQSPPGDTIQGLNKSQKQNTSPAIDKATAQEPGTASAAIIPPSILPWTLLI